MRKILIAISIVIFISSSYSQEVATTVNKPANIKFNMLALFDPVSAYQFSYEYGIGGRFNLQHEFGYITHNSPMYYGNDKKLDGFRIKTELKYYMPDREHTRTGMYFSGEAMWNKYSMTKEAQFAMQDWSYFQMMDVTKHKNVFAFHQKFGYQAGIKDSKVVFDFYIGLGVRSVYTQTDYPEEGELVSGEDLDFFTVFGSSDNGFSVRPSFTMGYKIGIFLSK